MNDHWAEENLQTIRTLMERSAVYRRALAPIMLFAGALGMIAAAIGLLCHLDSMPSFCGLWLGTAAVVVTGAFLNTRRQAIKDGEALWSPPTRRVAQALVPPLFAGMCIGGAFAYVGLTNPMIAAFIWLFFYGSALHSAGFFVQRGTKVFGWIIILGAATILWILVLFVQPSVDISAHWLMGFFFGVLHLLYGAYLYLTEKRKQAA